MVVGETGVGKEAMFDLLKALRDSDRPFVIRQLQGVADDKLISAIFGHVKGAYSGADANRAGAIKTASGGTLALDNLQTAGPDFFNLLLRVLDSKQEYQAMGSDRTEYANCRIVAGFNIRPEELLAKQQLPPDWPSRFGFRIDIPDLNDRKEDIPLLVNHFVSKLRSTNPLPNGIHDVQLMPPGIVETWCRQNWSGAAGNVRGLERAVEQHIRDYRRKHAHEVGLAKAGSKRVGRRPGRDIPDDELVGILLDVVKNPSCWTVDSLFSRINLCINNHHRGNTIKKTRGALQARIRKIDPVALQPACSTSEEAKTLRKKIYNSIKQVKEYETLPVSTLRS